VDGHRLTKTAAVTKAIFQPEKHREPDPSVVVIDEIVGMWVSLFLLPLDLLTVLTSFVLFRMFDVLKPPPARQVEHVPRGWGIMLDDIIAGIYANLGTRLLLFLLMVTHT
jgi:phosphatidylglycerophosphatase A